MNRHALLCCLLCLVLVFKESEAASSIIKCTPSVINWVWAPGSSSLSQLINIRKINSGDQNKWTASSASSSIDLIITPNSGTLKNSVDTSTIKLDISTPPTPGNYAVKVSYKITGGIGDTVTVNLQVLPVCENRTSCKACMLTDDCGYCLQNNTGASNITGQCISNSLSASCPDYFPSKCPTSCVFGCVNGTCNHHSGICLCNENYYGGDCSEFCLPQLNCSGHGACETNGVLASCDCDDNYYSSNCSVYCTAATNCSSVGTCTTGGACNCPAPYYGDSCEFISCPGNCNGHGTCNNKTGACVCDADYYSSNCDVYCESNATCNGHGACDSQSGACICDTDNGWYGTNCATYCMADTTCNNHGSCVYAGTCQCFDGFYTNNCSVACDPNVTCSGNGVCAINGTCQCSGPYFGDSCLQKMCDGYKTKSQCNLNGQCNFTTGLCHCDEGFNCEQNSNIFAGLATTNCYKCKLPFWTTKHIAIAAGVGGGLVLGFAALTFFLVRRHKRRDYRQI